MDPITTGIVSNGLWAGISTATRRLLRWQIKITHPRTGEMLQGAEPQGKVSTYPVRGTLRHLPKGHEIWLLTKDGGTGHIFPQGAVQVQYDPVNKTWEGRINWRGDPNLRIIAVVAPHTSQDFFCYYQKLGRLRNWTFEPLIRVPAECANSAEVQPRVLKS